ncbi:MAG: gamma-glutamyl-gamma-aminobutyrate hydrolase family protein [Alphaproteobacteria bacterium]
MSDHPPKPVVGIPVSINIHPEHGTRQHIAGEQYIRCTQMAAGGVPVLIPALGGDTDFGSLVSTLDGLLLTGGRANVEPHHYDGPPFPDDEFIDPQRDATVLPLIRACVDQGVPVFGICRGIQEINVALGGSLHYRIHLLPGKNDHRMRRDVDTREERFALRHALSLAPGGLLEELVGEGEVWTNSLHGQGVDQPAPGVVVEALSSDGVIEAIRLDDSDRFCVGVQWHAEYCVEDHELSRSLFERFGEAARKSAQRRARLRVV